MSKASKEEVLAYRNAGVVERIMQETGKDENEAILLFEDTLRFLWVASVADGPISPTKAVDEGWHTFLLFSKDYMRFCQQFLGVAYLHHSPFTSETKSDPRFRDRVVENRTRTLTTLTQEFGTSGLSANWEPLVTAFCASEGCDDCCDDCCAECVCSVGCEAYVRGEPSLEQKVITLFG